MREIVKCNTFLYVYSLYVYLKRGSQASAAARREVAEHISPVAAIELLEHKEHDDGVRADAQEVRREALPEREQALDAHHLHEHVLHTPANRCKYSMRLLVIYYERQALSLFKLRRMINCTQYCTRMRTYRFMYEYISNTVIVNYAICGNSK